MAGTPDLTALTALSNAELANDGFVTVKQAAAFLSVSQAFIRDRIERGNLPCMRDGRALRIPRRALLEYCGTKTVRRDKVYLIEQQRRSVRGAA